MDQDQYFSVSAQLTINIEPFKNNTLPSQDVFLNEIPVLFRVANQCAQLDGKISHDLDQINRDANSALMRYLTAQNEKINLLFGMLLTQEDNPAVRFQTKTFGASKLSYASATALSRGQLVKAKLFLESPTTAIYCYAKVTRCEAQSQGFVIELEYVRLQEHDHDTLIRAALFYQQKLLRQRAKNRNK